MRKFSTILVIATGFVILFYFFSIFLSEDNFFCDKNFLISYRLRNHDFYEEWYECMLPNISYLSRASPDQFWSEIHKPVRYCEGATSMKDLLMRPFSNSDETKWHILPIDRKHHSTILTIGVGQDTQAELELLKVVGFSNISFYGADPIVEGNKELYSAFGKFYPFALGNSSGLADSSVLVNGRYITKSVIHMEFLHFLKEILNKSFFDNIWIDGEGAEYEISHYFFNNGILDQNGITICQFNLEMHEPDEARKKAIQLFLLKIFDDRRYAFFRPVQATHLRLFFVNFRDQECLKTYIP